MYTITLASGAPGESQIYSLVAQAISEANAKFGFPAVTAAIITSWKDPSPTIQIRLPDDVTQSILDEISNKLQEGGLIAKVCRTFQIPIPAAPDKTVTQDWFYRIVVRCLEDGPDAEAKAGNMAARVDDFIKAHDAEQSVAIRRVETYDHNFHPEDFWVEIDIPSTFVHEEVSRLTSDLPAELYQVVQAVL